MVLHECTSYFKKSVFERHLLEYTVHRVIQDDTCDTSAEVMLSPHHLGWPMTRPRLYTVLIHKEKATLENFSVVMKSLFRRPHQKLGVHSLFVAPQDWTGLGHLKARLFTMKTSKKCRFLGGPWYIFHSTCSFFSFF